MIPKNIHQIWLQGEDHLRKNKPKLWRNAYHVKEFFDDCNYHLWEDDEIREVMKEDPALLSVYDSIDIKAAKADVARYFLVYTFGGVYLDMDFEPFENFWWIFDGDVDLVAVVLSRFEGDMKSFSEWMWPTSTGMNNAIFGASRFSPALLSLLDGIKNNTPKDDSKFAWSGIIEHVGSRSFERAVLSYQSTVNTRLIPSGMLEPIHPMDGTMHIDYNTVKEAKSRFPAALGVHKPDLSWSTPGSFSHIILTNAVASYGIIKDWSIHIIILLVFALIWLWWRKY